MKSISLFVLFWASINIHAVDNLRIPDIRSLGMGGNGVTQSVLFNPALVALNTDKVLYYLHFGQSDSIAATYSELMNMERWQNIS